MTNNLGNKYLDRTENISNQYSYLTTKFISFIHEAYCTFDKLAKYLGVVS